MNSKPETIVAIVTRATQKQSSWNPYAYHSNIIVFSSKRVFFLPTVSVVKGIAASTIVPIIGGLWHIKKLKEEDKIAENISISECEKKAERIIQNSNISEFKIEKKYGIKSGAILTREGEKIQFGTLDQIGLEKAEKKFETISSRNEK